MNAPVDVSVVLSTYNRAEMLRSALDALVLQEGGAAYEVIVVDNNSTDETADVVSRSVAAHPGRLRYVFEARQGLSYGRNAGIAASRGAIVAFTDDDVQVERDWVLHVKRAFDANPDVMYVGGRVLPRWVAAPPVWLTTAHWSPLALQDYGDLPVRTGPAFPVCLVGANLAFRREVFDRVGLFTPDFGRVKDGIGSTEDHDMQLRIWLSGFEGMYVPDVRMLADVTPDRLTLAYHRRWHHGHGRHCARMRLKEIVPRDFSPMGRPPDLVTLFGVPGYVYLQAVKTAWRWLDALVHRRDALFYSNRLRHLSSYVLETWRMNRKERSRSPLSEMWRFTAAYAHKLRSRVRGRLRQAMN